MARELKQEFVDIIRPRVKDEDVMLPISFNYSGGRGESGRTRIFIAWLLGVVGAILCWGILFGDGRAGIISRVVLTAVIGYIILIIIRYPLLREQYLRESYEKLDELDYKLDEVSLWNIMDIEDTPYHACHFAGGAIGIFIYLEKDVVIGKTDLDEFNHFEAIAEAIKKAHYYKARLRKLDYMASIGKDERFSNVYENLAKCDNELLKRDLNYIYSYLEKRLEKEVTTYDVYALYVPNTENRYNFIATKVLAELLKANYVGYRFLDEADIQALVTDLFGVEEFSTKTAMAQVSSASTAEVVRPIRIVRGNKYKVLGKTLEEEKKERELQMEQQRLVRLELERKKKEEKEARKGIKPKKVKTKKIEL